MKNVVITGSTSGVGLGLVQAFLSRGCTVVISGRNMDKINLAVDQLSTKYGKEQLIGCECDVSIYDDVQRLWNVAISNFGKVDIWINNAATINAQLPFTSLNVKDITNVVNTNLCGTMYGSLIALRGMLSQGFGQLYNMEGYGSNGSMRSGMGIYGATKRGVRYFTRAIAKELKHTPLKICTLSPGAVITDAVIKSYRYGLPENKRWGQLIYSIMSDDCDTVCPWLVKQIISNNKTGRHIAWLTFPRILKHIMCAGFRKREVFGNANPPAKDCRAGSQ
jgi:short-subunit dehydrogenase